MAVQYATEMAPRTRAYKDFLTPALHRRFTQAAGTVLLLCLFDSWLLSSSSSSSLLWSWFPLGPAGVRALLLFMPCLAVFIIRVANMHIAKRPSHSLAETLSVQLLSTRAVHTLLWYLFSSWLFGEIYIWSSSTGLQIVDPGRPYERPELNENPIFVRSSFVVLGVVRCVWHLVADYDQVAIPTGKEEQGPKPNIITSTLGIQPATIARLPRPFQALLERLGAMANTCGQTVAIAWLANMVFYFLIVRYPAWRWTYSLVKPFFSQMQPSTTPRGFTHAPTVIWQSLSSAFMLCVLWEYSNTVFDALVTQPPIRKGQPLTSEIKDARGVVLHKSTDPNGSLVNGLKSKKEVTKAFAFWELFLIATKYDTRRKSIYTEVDRKDGSTWSQVCQAILQEINSASGSTVVHAAKSISKLVVSSLKEDDFGLVQRDIAAVVRVLTNTIQSTDGRETDALKGALEDIMLAFGEYTSTLGLSKKEAREAREIVS